MTTSYAAGRSLLGPAHPAHQPASAAVGECAGHAIAGRSHGGRGVGGFQGRAAKPEFDGGPAVNELYGRSDAEPAAPPAVASLPTAPPADDASGAPDDGTPAISNFFDGDKRANPRRGRADRDAGRRGRKLLVPYLTAGVSADWVDYLLAMQEAGADAIEVGLPFSDPMLDGVTVQQSSDRALARGVTVGSILRELHEVRDRVRVPLIAFTYSNLVFRPGPVAFCRQLADAGVSGLIVPDLPVDEGRAVEEAAAAAGIALPLLVAPVTTDERLAEIVDRSRGFIYAISRMGTTGERDALASSAAMLATRIKAAQARLTGDGGSGAGRLPVLVGFGISGVKQAAAAGRAGDGVVVGSALMRRVLDGATPRELGAEVAALRAALDDLDEEASADRTAHAEVSGDRR